MQKTKTVYADKIDGITDDIPNYLGSIYKELYNCVQEGEEIKQI